jgi:hypothetical protein
MHLFGHDRDHDYWFRLPDEGGAGRPNNYSVLDLDESQTADEFLRAQAFGPQLDLDLNPRWTPTQGERNVIFWNAIYPPFR